MEWISRIGDLAKIPTRISAVLAVSSGALLFLPLSMLKRMGLAQFREEFTSYIGIVFLISISLLVADLMVWIYSKNLILRKKNNAEAAVKNYMFELDGAEKAVLREFFIAGNRSLRLPHAQPAVASLLNAGVLVQATSSGVRTTVGSVYALSISKPAEALLNPELVGLGQYVIHTEDGEWDLTEEGQDWLNASRPPFMSALERDLSRLDGRLW